MIATRYQASLALETLFGTDDPCIMDLSERELEFVEQFINPVITGHVEREIVEELYDDLEIPEPDEEWIDEEEIYHRFLKIVQYLGLDDSGIEDQPNPIAQAFGAEYHPGGVHVVQWDEAEYNSTFVLATSWKDVAAIQREYNRRYNWLRFKLWDDVYERAASESKFGDAPWENLMLGRAEDGHITDRYNARRYTIDTWLGPKEKEDTFTPHGLIDIGKLCEIEFNDSYTICHNCGLPVCTKPDSHSWQPEYHKYEDGNTICLECIQADKRLQEIYLEEKTNEDALVNIHVADPDAHGWVPVNMDFETGFHHGQNDSPAAVIEILNDDGIDCLFTGNVSQFDMEWTVWVHDGDEGAALEVLLTENTKLPYEPADALKRALQGKPSEITVRKVEFRDGEVISDTTNNDYVEEEQ